MKSSEAASFPVIVHSALFIVLIKHIYAVHKERPDFSRSQIWYIGLERSDSPFFFLKKNLAALRTVGPHTCT